jgi:uncharacterized membrane protein YhaH (DUF805 family)
MSEFSPMPPPSDDSTPQYLLAPSSDPANAPKDVGFSEALSRGFSRFAKFSGRASRSEYWWFMLAAMPVLYVCCLGLGIGLIPVLAVTSRRIHDTGRSATPYFYGLAAMVPVCGILAFVSVAESWDRQKYLADWQKGGLLLSVLGFGAYWLSATLRPGTNGSNEFGPGLSN